MSVDYRILLIKQAGFAGQIASFLSKGVPKAFEAVNKGSKAMGLGAKNLPLMTGAAGATIGAVRGSSKAEEGDKARGAITGALTGGALGFFGGKGLNTLPTLGKNTVPHLENAGKALAGALKDNPNLGAKELLSRGNSYMARNFSNQWAKAPAGLDQMKPMLGKAKSVEEVLVGPKKSGIISGLGEMAQNVERVKKDGVVKGVGKGLWANIQNARKFTSDVQLPGGATATHRATRSIAGQAINVGLSSGVGMGALEAAQSKDEHGNVRPMSKRIMKGTGTALAWGLATPVMATKATLGLPKMFMGGNKQPPIESTT